MRIFLQRVIKFHEYANGLAKSEAVFVCKNTEGPSPASGELLTFLRTKRNILQKLGKELARGRATVLHPSLL
jgi:hypothetical protein